MDRLGCVIFMVIVLLAYCSMAPENDDTSNLILNAHQACEMQTGARCDTL